MIMYNCKHCGKFTMYGYVNEFQERFCDYRCYKLYCGINGYEVHLEKLTPIEIKKD